ncbi:MAG TPA: GFA family protein [Steroidobacteraceae bacterium]|nr:GFA family protein [Steroidobacteraceae bacterium]
MNHAEGGCLCGVIRYRVTGAPSWSTICHCRTCRRAGGAPSVGWLTFDRASFSVLRGVPGRFVSSPGVVRTFCTVCGTPLTYSNEGRPGDVDVTTMSLDDETRFPPTSEVWISDKVSWEIADPTRAQYPGDVSDAPV